MEKNWINDIIEFISKAIENRFSIECASDSNQYYKFEVTKDNQDNVIIFISHFDGNYTLSIITRKGEIHQSIKVTPRDIVALDGLVLDIKEYGTSMAVSEFENFFNDESSKVMNIDDLDNED